MVESVFTGVLVGINCSFVELVLGLVCLTFL